MSPRAAASDEPTGGLPRNFLRACLLLLLRESPAHGYDLLEEISGLGLNGVDPGGLYRALRSMDRDGQVESWWETSEVGPARRTYRLTDEGVEWLHAWAGALRESHRYLSDYLVRYERVAPAVVGDPGVVDNPGIVDIVEAEAGLETKT